MYGKSCGFVVEIILAFLAAVPVLSQNSNGPQVFLLERVAVQAGQAWKAIKWDALSTRNMLRRQGHVQIAGLPPPV